MRQKSFLASRHVHSYMRRCSSSPKHLLISASSSNVENSWFKTTSAVLHERPLAKKGVWVGQNGASHGEWLWQQNHGKLVFIVLCWVSRSALLLQCHSGAWVAAAKKRVFVLSHL